MFFAEYAAIKYNKTVRGYCECIMRLVEAYGAESVTVQQICAETETNRSTFYNYFPDKYALMNYVYFHDNYPTVRHLFEKGENRLNSIEEYYKWATAHFALLTRPDRMNYYKKLAKLDGQNCFCDFHRAFWYEVYKKIMLNYYKLSELPSHYDFVVQVWVNGLCMTTINWLLQDCPEKENMDMAELCYIFMAPELRAAVTNGALDE